MVKRIFRLVLKIILGTFLFYLFLGFIVIPIVLKWGIESQASKILKAVVLVRSVSVNPIMLSAGMNDFEVKDVDKQVLVGFEKLTFDISFLSLFKKSCRIESVRLDGLRVNVRLLAGNRVNLMDLVPAPSSAPTLLEPQAVPSGALADASEWPLVVVDSVSVRRSQVYFSDETVTPRFKTTLGDIDIQLTGLSTDPQSSSKLVFKGKLDEKGLIALEAQMKPFAQPLDLEAAVSLNNYALTILSPYVEKYTGRKLDDGKFDLKMDYRIAGNKLTASHKILIQHFTFGQKIESKDALVLPFGLALALLEDSNGQIKIALPVTGDMCDPEFKYWPLVGQVVKNFFFKVVTKPFAFLGSMMGSENGTDELGYVRFIPGRADMADAEEEKLVTIVKGLKERHRLRLQVQGSYDPDTDWKAIKAATLLKDYNELKRESSGSEMNIYEQLYQRSFGVRDLWVVTKKCKRRDGSYDEEKVVEELKRQLIENAPADQAAMEALAAARAKQVYEAVLSLGLDPERVSTAPGHAVQGSMGFVPLEFTLTVFDSQS